MVNVLKTFINGLAFGITQIVPGVSGGTVAIMMGFYDRLLESVNHFNKDRRKSLKFLLPFLFGIAVGILVFSSVINFLLSNHSFPTMMFFIGMIIGIIPLIFAKIKPINRTDVILIVIPALVVFATSFIGNGVYANPSILIFFIAGVVSAAALIIPGISGSFILLIMGVYHEIIISVSSVFDLLRDITNTGLWRDICVVMVPFAVGVVIGGLSMARLIEKLLKNYSRRVYTIILGLLIGSAAALFNNPTNTQSGINNLIIAIGITALLTGGIFSYFIGRKRV